LEAALPHATDLRSVKFLFLPPEHDPDSFVRERGAPAFEAAVAAAVPLSRQLIELASEDADLATAEGRSRMLAQAKPLWLALPDGALKRQLQPELARQAQLSTDDLVSLWGGAAAAAPRPPAAAPAPMSMPRRPVRSAGRRAPAASADLALRLLLRHSDWWERLSADDQHLLHDLGGAHGQVVAWLEQQITEHGPQTWATLEAALSGTPLHAQALQWVDSAAFDEEHSFDDLQRVVHRLWVAHYRELMNALIAEGRTDREQLDRIDACGKQIQHHQTAQMQPAS
jgi:DNA primase